MAGSVAVRWTTEGRGSSNEKARRELEWPPHWSSWREGFRAGLTEGRRTNVHAERSASAGDTWAARRSISVRRSVRDDHALRDAEPPTTSATAPSARKRPMNAPLACARRRGKPQAPYPAQAARWPA
jgi:hypothetical protein